MGSLLLTARPIGPESVRSAAVHRELGLTES